MTVPTSQTDQALKVLKARGILRLNELMAAGVAQETMARLVRSGRVTRLARGLYQLAGSDPETAHSFAEASKLVPKGVVCLVSALQFHELTVQLSRAIWMAIETGSSTPRIAYPPMRFVRFSKKAMSEGIEHHTIEGVTVRVTDPATTIADCFCFRSKVGIDVALEGLREALRRRPTMADAIMKAAQRRRIWTKLRPYLEALLEHDG
ncbi:MAG: type IV toxin-antitoxin system AbiEi family antitoxin domain-containing protein [Alphaproteobacteria bacterium]|nr:type IV toxin-antitoxin system AbiEi family antitoxin domain-containing protein [Alphaproteobacteria bacterium]MDE2495017.1 type IV toxin-antitoxin system AbiEi family antitoxin domain-containing protein [Alphaproteobacteria bacterium]